MRILKAARKLTLQTASYAAARVASPSLYARVDRAQDARALLDAAVKLATAPGATPAAPRRPL